MHGLKIGAATAIAAAILMAPAAEAQVELVYANGYAKTTISTGVIADEWINAIEEATEGRVRIRHVHGGALIKPEVMVEGVKGGVADIGSLIIPFFPGQLPISAALASTVDVDLGNRLGPNDTVEIVAEMVRQSSAFEDEYARLGLKAVFWIAAPPYATLSSKPVSKMDDFEGLKVRTFGNYQDILAAAGASPLSMAFSEVYTSMQTGVIDALVTDAPAMVVNRLFEVGEHMFTWGPEGGAQTAIPSIVFVFNLESWEKIPAEDREIIERVSQDMLQVGAERILESQAASTQALLDEGVTIVHLTDDEAKILTDRLGNVYDQAAAQITESGAAGAELLGLYVKLASERAQ